MKNIILLLLISFSATCQNLASQNLASQDSTKNLAPVQMKVLAPEVHMRNLIKFQEESNTLIAGASLGIILYGLLTHKSSQEPALALGICLATGGYGLAKSLRMNGQLLEYREKHFPRKKKVNQ